MERRRCGATGRSTRRSAGSPPDGDAGRCLLLVGAGVLAAIHLSATEGEALDLGRIVGGAVVVVGLLVYGFGLLVSTNSRAPRERR
ncbi:MULTISPECIES: hypothetical protein [Luteimonas]|uniref:hypothetical protein n=1 Tax=Luteimonas TaxID=83614 RepID=UPI0011808E64|nr:MULTISPECIES: hypothetical protein [Luteimonas]